VSDRLVTLFGAVVAFVAVILLLAPPADVGPRSGSVPTSLDTGPQGLAALRQWLEQSEVPTASLKERYTGLITRPDLPEQGNLLISVLPHRDTSRPNERAYLQRWVERGNSVLLLTALSDWPAWAVRSDRDVFALPGQLGFEPAPWEPEESAEPRNEEDLPVLPERRSRVLRPPAAVPSLRGIEGVSAYWLTSEQAQWRLEPKAPGRSVLVLLEDELNEPAFWQARAGQGRIWVSRHAQLFNNAVLGETDNAAFAARLVGSALGQGGRVIFDDRHHGITNVYDPDAFFQDPRLHNTLWFLLALWVIYLLGHTNRFAPASGAKPPVSLAKEVRAVGGFLARRVSPAAVARRLLEHFHNEVRTALHLPRNGRPAWKPLEGHANIHPDLLRRAGELEARAQAGQSVNLRELVNTLKRIKEQLT